MSYIGSNPVTQSFIAGTDYFNGDGSTTAFTLSRSVVSTNDIQATVNNVVQQPNTAYTVNGTTITFTSAPSAGTGNIYVRYLSTTTQSITPSQNTVSYSTLNSDNQSKLGISFKNRIINGAMVIDQRNAGASTSAVNGTYTLDRWATLSFTGGGVTGKFTVQQNAGSVTSPVGFSNYIGLTSSAATTVSSGSIFGLYQYIEGYNVADLNWGTANAKTITLSFWVYSSLTGTYGCALQNAATNRNYPFTYTINSANTWEQKSVTITGDTTGTWGTTNGVGIALIFGLGIGSSYSGTAGAWTGTANVYGATGSTNWVSTSGATFYLTGVQLEVGTQATTFDYRSYGTELALCQRYYSVISGNGTAYAGLGSGFGTGTTTGNAYVQFPVTMRSIPTVTNVNAWVNTTAANTAITSISPSSGFNGTFLSSFTVASGITTGQGLLITAGSSGNGAITMSAEL